MAAVLPSDIQAKTRVQLNDSSGNLQACTCIELR